MATLSTNRFVARLLASPSYQSVATGDKFFPGDNVFLHIRNGAGTARNLTILTPGQVVDGVDIDSIVATVAAGQEGMFGPFPPDIFAGSDGLATITASDTSSVTVAVLDISVSSS